MGELKAPASVAGIGAGPICPLWEVPFAVRFRWIETVHEKELAFRFEGETCFITEEGVAGRFPSLGGVTEACLENGK